MSASSIHRSAYRSLLRELARTSIHPREKRNAVILRSVRTMFEEDIVKQKEPKHNSSFLRQMNNTTIFLQSQRIYKELLERYNPTHTMSQEERVQATARRVGLDIPEEGNGK